MAGRRVTRAILPTAAAAAALVVAFSYALRGQDAEADGEAEGKSDTARGAELYAENCASCHGEKLEGQPDWRSSGPDGILPAPPHDETGHTWHHPDSILFAYTKLGGKEALARQGIEFNSGMPGFGDQLSDREIRDILAFIRSTWPARIRDVQAERTKADMELERD